MERRGQSHTEGSRSAASATFRIHSLLQVISFDRRSAIRATPTVFRGWNTYDFPTVPNWHRGRLIIIGDAGAGRAASSSPAS